MVKFMFNPKKSAAILLAGVLTINLLAQPRVLKLWPDGIPGSKNDPAYIENIVTTDGRVTRANNVITPDLTVFLPDPAKANGAAVLICPGGGYGTLAFDHEGNAIAKWLNDNGIAGIILKYRLPSDRIMNDKSIGPLQDAQEAMRVIRRNAVEWKINPNRVGVIGFSAGGHLASTISTHYTDKVYEVKDNISARPDFSLLIYPVISMDTAITHRGSRNNLIGIDPTEKNVLRFSNEKQITGDTPPAFLVHSSDDNAVPVMNSIGYYLGLRKNKIPAELHIFQKGGHGYGLSPNGGTESSWPGLCIKWLKAMGLI
jgi:acetyl esterase/lipase